MGAKICLSGNVGIGAAAPAGKLGVNGGVGIGTFYNDLPPTNGLIVSGKVGIGTASPAAKLDVSGSANFGVRGKTSATNYAGVIGEGGANSEGVQGITDSTSKAALWGNNTVYGPALEIKRGWIRIPSVSASSDGGNVVINQIAGIVEATTGLGWIKVLNRYVTANSIIIATRQDGASDIGVRNVILGSFEIYNPVGYKTAFLVINQ